MRKLNRSVAVAVCLYYTADFCLAADFILYFMKIVRDCVERDFRPCSFYKIHFITPIIIEVHR